MSAAMRAARAALAEATGHAPVDVPDDAAIDTLAGWDSIAHMRVVLAVERARGAPLETGEILALTSLRALAAAWPAA